MNRESLAISIKKELTCFYSRSRQELWLKGETSGNYQHIVSITADCDNDALVVVVEKDGPACHTGSDSCFTKPVYESPNRAAFSADGLYELLADRKETLPEGSYTTYLFEKGIDKILKKVGEESTEVIIASKGNDQEGDRLRDRRSGLSRHGDDGRNGHLFGRCAQGTGLPSCH